MCQKCSKISFENFALCKNLDISQLWFAVEQMELYFLKQARKLQATLVPVRNYHRLADGGEV